MSNDGQNNVFEERELNIKYPKILQAFRTYVHSGHDIPDSFLLPLYHTETPSHLDSNDQPQVMQPTRQPPRPVRRAPSLSEREEGEFIDDLSPPPVGGNNTRGAKRENTATNMEMDGEVTKTELPPKDPPVNKNPTDKPKRNTRSKIPKNTTSEDNTNGKTGIRKRGPSDREDDWENQKKTPCFNDNNNDDPPNNSWRDLPNFPPLPQGSEINYLNIMKAVLPGNHREFNEAWLNPVSPLSPEIQKFVAEDFGLDPEKLALFRDALNKECQLHKDAGIVARDMLSWASSFRSFTALRSKMDNIIKAFSVNNYMKNSESFKTSFEDSYNKMKDSVKDVGVVFGKIDEIVNADDVESIQKYMDDNDDKLIEELKSLQKKEVGLCTEFQSFKSSFDTIYIALEDMKKELGELEKDTVKKYDHQAKKISKLIKSLEDAKRVRDQEKRGLYP